MSTGVPKFSDRPSGAGVLTIFSSSGTAAACSCMSPSVVATACRARLESVLSLLVSSSFKDCLQMLLSFLPLALADRELHTQDESAHDVHGRSVAGRDLPLDLCRAACPHGPIDQQPADALRIGQIVRELLFVEQHIVGTRGREHQLFEKLTYFARWKISPRQTRDSCDIRVAISVKTV